MTAPGRASRAREVLLYDGDCGFCSRSVQFVLRHDRRGTLQFAALSSPFGRQIVDRTPRLRGVDSMVWVELDPDGELQHVFVRSASALRVARYLGGAWAVLGALALLVPRPLRDAAYDWIARHRRQLGGAAACDLVPAAQRHRFLDAV